MFLQINPNKCRSIAIFVQDFFIYLFYLFIFFLHIFKAVTGQFFGKIDSEIMKQLVKGDDSSLSHPLYEK